ncbi:MAG: P-loop NTPase [Candidatus Hydrogenedentes bacterium]|nr:P-loop NTPase [Candidatus Hydrogenedentota bacterium]
MITESAVLAALSNIIDPDLGRDVVSLGFIKELSIADGAVSFKMELTTPACPVKEQFKTQAESLVKAIPGVRAVEVSFSAMAPKSRPGPSTDTLKSIDTIIAVSSCKGGVGKSTVAAHLARAIQREGHAVGLLDADIYGPSLPTLFHVQEPEVYMRGELIEPVVVDGLKTMSLGYMMGDKPAVLRGPMASNYTTQILRQTDWGKLDYLIIDMPPGTGDIQLTLVQQAAIDGAIIVTTPQALSLVDVQRGILMFEKVSVPVLGIVENMAYYSCGDCGKPQFIFGDSTGKLKERFGLSTLAQLPILPGISSTAHKGDGENIAAFAQLAENLHREIGKRRMNAEEKPQAVAEKAFMRVIWPDGTESRVSNREVLSACKCARCVNEYTDAVIIDKRTLPSEIHIEHIEPLGNYAVSVTWDHGCCSTSIVTWDLLRRVAGLPKL